MALFEIYIHKNYGWIDLSVEPNEAAISQKNSVLIHQISTLVFQTQMYWYYLFFRIKGCKCIYRL